MVGAAVSYTILLWIALGSMFLLEVQPRVELPPTFTDMCPNSTVNFTTVTATTWQNLVTSDHSEVTG